MADPITSKLTPPPNGSELLRENLFKENADEDEGELLKRREPTMLRRGKKLVAPPHDESKKYTVVFDLDETVVYARDGPLYARAYLKDLFRSIKDDFEVIVWTAGERDYAKCILEEINEDHIIQHLVYRHKKWFNEEDYTKDLRQLGRDLNYTIMIENTPDCVRANPQNGIIVEDFEVLPETTDDEASTPSSPAPTPPPQQQPSMKTADEREEQRVNDEAQDKAGSSTTAHAGAAAAPASKEDSCGPTAPPLRRRRTTDRTLFLLREVLSALVKSGATVPAFLASCELLSQQTVIGSDGNEIPIYHLGTRRRRRDAGAPRKVVKANRDKAPPPPPPAATAKASAPTAAELPKTVERPAKTATSDGDNGNNNGDDVTVSESSLLAKKHKHRSETSLDEAPLLSCSSTDSI